MGLSVTGALFLAASAQADFSSPYSNGIGLNFTAGGDGLVADSVAAGYAGPTSFAGSAPLAAIQSQTHWNNVIGIGADVLIGGKDATNASLLNTFRVTTAGGWLGSSGLYEAVDTTGAVGTIYRDALAGGANVWDDVFTPLAAVTVTGIPYQNYDVAILTSWLGQDDLSWWLLTPTGNLGIRQGDNGASHGAFNGPTFSWSVDSDQSKGAIFALQILNKETPSLKWIGKPSG